MVDGERNKLNVLVACECSGRVKTAFRNKGHNAWSCDLEPSEILDDKYHMQDDVLKHLNDGWDLMIAHPPCTYLSNAGARFMYPNGILSEERLQKASNGKKLFMALYNSSINRICIENPIPIKIVKLPPYSQIIEPYYFLDAAQKKTCLWLKNLPFLMYTGILEKPQSTKVPGNWFNKGGKDRQSNRSRTFQGIANAMANQWG
ncbi:DNA cytosine methyltransferase [Candidatus Dojkabacteria bacterium]|jgi:hypothetical protein|nr:DNA cytosine methyltransferase [Candidatus Dojkabacteria bacterium]